MKRKFLIGFIVLTICVAAGGFYITRSIADVIEKLETIITLHQVKILRTDLLTDVKAVQQDLLLKDSPHAATVDTFILHGEQMLAQVEGCFDCHHDDPSKSQLEELREEIYSYQGSLSRVYTTRASSERVNAAKQVAFQIGQHIIQEINGIIELSSDNLAYKTEVAKDSIAETKRLLTILIIVGPFLGVVIALFLVRDFTGSVETLIAAIRRFKAGELEYKIEGLKDEFGELGDSFNEMALSLSDMIRKMEENQKLYRMLFEGAGDGIFILEAEGENVGRIVSANKAAADMHGYTVEELLELRITDLDSPEAVAENPQRIRRILAGEWIDTEISHRMKDGRVFPVEISAGLLELDDQKFILAFDKDITERKQAEEALQRAERLVVVGEMAAGLAHEIKNPLAGIKVSIEVLTSELQLEPEDAKVFDRIVGEINRIETLLKNLLSYAMPPTPQFAQIDVNRIIESAIKTVVFSLKSPAQKTKSREVKDIRFVKDLSDRLPRITADPAQLQQVILNLFLNAIQAIPEAGSVSVKTSADSDRFIRIVVSDTGKGIDEKDLGNMFQPFFTTKPKGTGLGLPICKRLIEQQNGSIEVAYSATGGLRFSINLPVEQRSLG
jgi:two-component system sensor histidine kinase AtoS